jgi:hypothetical protein
MVPPSPLSERFATLVAETAELFMNEEEPFLISRSVLLTNTLLDKV